MSNSTESIYEPLWFRLKRDKVLSIRVHPTNFRRIVDGIRKRKDKDIRFKKLNAVDPCRLQILRKPEENIVIFFLRQSVGISNIIVPEAIDAVVDNLTDGDI